MGRKQDLLWPSLYTGFHISLLPGLAIPFLGFRLSCLCSEGWSLQTRLSTRLCPLTTGWVCWWEGRKRLYPSSASLTGLWQHNLLSRLPVLPKELEDVRYELTQIRIHLPNVPCPYHLSPNFKGCSRKSIYLSPWHLLPASSGLAFYYLFLPHMHLHYFSLTSLYP